MENHHTIENSEDYDLRVIDTESLPEGITAEHIPSEGRRIERHYTVDDLVAESVPGVAEMDSGTSLNEEGVFARFGEEAAEIVGELQD